MATKTKKAPAKVAPKKVAAPKPAKAGVKKASSVKFVSFSVRGVIPTMAYGNIQPEITVSAATYEEARDFAMPLMENLFAQYSETKPTFLGKIEVTEKVVAPAPKAEATTPSSPSSTAASESTTPEPQSSTSTPEKPKSEFVLKAEKMIGLAMTEEAAIRIQDQIEKSTKIATEDKPALIELVLKKRNSFKKPA